MNFYSYFAHFFSYLGEIQYNSFRQNAVEYLWVSRKLTQGRPYRSSSSLALQPALSQSLLLKLPPAVPIPCSIPPISLPQLLGIFPHSVLPLYFWPILLPSSFYYCYEDFSCRILLLQSNNMSSPS